MRTESPRQQKLSQRLDVLIELGLFGLLRYHSQLSDITEPTWTSCCSNQLIVGTEDLLSKHLRLSNLCLLPLRFSFSEHVEILLPSLCELFISAFDYLFICLFLLPEPRPRYCLLPIASPCLHLGMRAGETQNLSDSPGQFSFHRSVLLLLLPLSSITHSCTSSQLMGSAALSF